MKAGGLEILLSAGLARLSQDMTEARRLVGGTMKDIERSAGIAESALGKIGALASAGLFIHLIKGAIDANDRLNDLSKSTTIAADTLAGLQFLAKQTGGEVGGMAASINKLAENMGKYPEKFAALGIATKDPLEAFKQFADIFAAIEDPQVRAALGAEALGKSWQTAAPALAEGGKRIGEMIERGRELSGVTPELVSLSDEFNDKLVELWGSGDVLNGVLDGLLPLLIEAADALLKVKEEAGFAGEVIASGIVEGLRAIMVVGGNVAFVLKAIGTEIGGIAAQAVAFFSGDFSGAADIGRRMKADAIEARKAFDEWEAKILAVGKASEKTGGQVKGMSEEDLEAARIAKDAAKAAEAKAKAFLDNEKAAKAAKDALREQQEQLEAYVKAQEKAAAMDAEVAREIAELDKRRTDAILSAEKVIAQVEFETELLGLSNVERQKAIALRNLETSGINAQDDAYAELSRRLTEAIDRQELVRVTRERQLEGMRQEAAMWGELSDAAGGFFSDLLMNGKSAFDNLKDYARQFFAEMVALFAKRLVLQLAAGVTGSAGLAAQAAGVGGNSLAGTALNAGLNWLGTGTGLGSSIVAGGSSFLQGMTGTFMGPMQPGSMAAMGSEFAAFMTNPVTLAVLAAVVIAVALRARQGGPKEGGSSFGDYDAQGRFLGDRAVPGSDNGRFYTPSTMDRDARRMTDSVASGFATALRALGGRSGGVSFGLGFDMDPRGRAENRVSSEVLMNGASIYSQRNLTAGRDNEDLERVLSLESQRMILAALQASDLPEEVANILNSVTASTATEEEIREVIAAATEMAQILKALAAIKIEGLDVGRLEEMQLAGETLTQTFERVAGVFMATSRIADSAFGGVGIATYEARAQLVEFAGGTEALSTALEAYYANFFTAGERFQIAFGQLASQFSDLGLTMPRTRQGFRDLVQGFDLTTESGRRLYGSVIGLSPAMAQLYGHMEDLEGFYRANFFTAAEQAAMAAADVRAEFAALGLEMPDSAEGFRALVEGIDRSTEAGEALYWSLLELAPAFLDVVKPVENLLGVIGSGDLIVAGQEWAAAALERVRGLEAAGETMQERLSLRSTGISGEIANVQAALGVRYAMGLTNDNETFKLEAALRELQKALAATGQSLGRLTVLTAQYGQSKAEELLNLEEWYEAQKLILAGNLPALEALAGIFDERWAEIIEGTTDGVGELEEALIRARESILEFRDSLLLSSLSPLTPEQRIAQAQADYERLLAEATGPGATAETLAEFQAAAQAYLNEARSFFASSSDYTAIFERVFRDLGIVGGETPEEAGAQLSELVDGTSLVAQNTAATAEKLDQLQARVDALTQAVLSSSTASSDAMVGAVGDLRDSIVSAIAAAG